MLDVGCRAVLGLALHALVRARACGSASVRRRNDLEHLEQRLKQARLPVGWYTKPTFLQQAQYQKQKQHPWVKARRNPLLQRHRQRRNFQIRHG